MKLKMNSMLQKRLDDYSGCERAEGSWVGILDGSPRGLQITKNNESSSNVQYLLDLFFAVEIGRNVSGGGENVLNHTVMYFAVIIPCCRVLVEALFVCLTQ